MAIIIFGLIEHMSETSVTSFKYELNTELFFDFTRGSPKTEFDVLKIVYLSLHV